MSRILNNNNLIAVLDIGTSKTCCVLAYPVNEDKAVIVGAGSHQNKGVRNSEIVSLAATVDSVSHAVANAETFVKERIKTVVATACTGKLSTSFTEHGLDLNGAEITQNEMDRLISGAQNKIPVSEDEVLHCIPIDYSLDSVHSIADPRGLTGNRLGVVLHTVTTPPCPVRNMNAVLEQNHLSCSKKVAAPYAAGLACLTQEEKKQGTAVVDLGAGTTGIAVFYEDQLIFTAQIPSGGDDITQEIAKTFKTSLDNAERIKTLKGSALKSLTYEQEDVEIPLIGEDKKFSVRHVPRSEIVRIIEEKIENRFKEIKALLKQNKLYDICLNFVLTGGGASLHGIKEKVEEVLSNTDEERNAGNGNEPPPSEKDLLSVRIGTPLRLFDKQEIIPSHAYQTYMGCIGLLHYTTRILLNTPARQRDIPAGGNKFMKFFRWFLDNS